MNLEGHHTSPSASVRRVPIASSSQSVTEPSNHPQRGPSLSSIPSENDWISPFTLPPLPAPRRGHDQPGNPRSPEHPGQRESSGAYYAAAWGSPYASPSPQAVKHHRQGPRSVDFSSPSHPTSSPLTSVSSRIRPPIDAGNVLSPAGGVPLRRNQSEKPNWLSDSEESGRDEALKDEHGTPRGARSLASWTTSPAQFLRKSSTGSHQNTESTDTVTPESFLRRPSIRRKAMMEGAVSRRMASLDEGQSFDHLQENSSPTKPLPELPRRASRDSTDLTKVESPLSPTRPRPGSMHSFQRPRRKVVWKGKACIIALPMTDRESEGLPPLLTPQEVKQKVNSLVEQGYNVNGFELDHAVQGMSTANSSRSRSPHPDPAEMQAERQMRQFTVYIPNQAEWQKWCEYLQEEKLRALGVTPSSSEPAPSAVSPLSAPLSRTSSRHTGPLISPPAATSSAASNPLRSSSNALSPTFSASSAFGSQVGSGSSSQFNGHPGSHGYKQSLAFSKQQGRTISPDYPGAQHLHSSSAQRSPVDALMRRQSGFSPAGPAGMQSLGEILSPISNAPPNNALQDRNTNMPQSPRPGEGTQFPGPQGPPSTALSPTATSIQSSSLPRTPIVDQPSRPPIEIQHPTPRSHRHNLSATLQKEIEDAEAALEKQDRSHDELGKDVEKGGPIQDPVGEEEANDELPILKRPETIGASEDRSDIETNPSIAASPMLLDKENPFANWQALSDAARGDKLPSYKGHKAHSSVSKLNVQAKEFDPTAGFQSSNFNFGAKDFKPFAAPSQPPMSLVGRATGATQRPGAKLNVEAPTFVPGGAPPPPTKESSEEPSPFKFSSATFNVDAPEFNPDCIPTKDFQSVADASSEPAPKTSIFGEVKIDPDSKVSRRTSKAVPILRPRSKDGPAQSSSSVSSIRSSADESVEEDDGRPAAPTDRAKRARTVDSDGDQSPIYADSAPFNNSRILSEIVHEGEAHPTAEEEAEEESKEKPVDGWSYIPADASTNNSRILSEIVNEIETHSVEERPEEKPVDGWSYVPADDARLEVLEKTPPMATPVVEMQEKPAPFVFRNEDDAIKFSEARPRSESESDDESVPEDLALSPVRQDKSEEELSPAAHKANFSFSALAAPFEFKPPQRQAPPTAQAQIDPKPAKAKGGLMASKFAATPSPSPPTSPAAAVDRPSSPPVRSDPFVASEREEETEEVSKLEDYEVPRTSEQEDDQVTIDFPDTPAFPEPPRNVRPAQDLRPVRSPPRAPRPIDSMSAYSPDYQPRVNESTSVIESPYVPTQEKVLPEMEFSDAGDDLMPSFEEIDAVMKQFEKNPELGIERHDSPVGSTPLVDMRLGNNFRSDAPSPSPRRDGQHPALHDEAASTAAFGLGLGIRRLNAGKEDVSDWNDALSTSDELKLQSRANFFDGHVNDIVDGVLESRLEPLQRQLQTIQQSIARMAVRPTRKESKNGRRSMSTDVKESDADDEDDYDAFEGFSSYRARSPESKRNRHTSRIRAAVAEGMAAYRESALQQQPVDLSQLYAELAEMRELVKQQKTAKTVSIEQPAITDLKATLENVISKHPRLRGSRVQQEHEGGQANLKLQVDGLEAMLKFEQERADHEAKLRKKTEEEIELLKQQLRAAEDEAAEHREASEMAQHNLEAFVKEKDAYKALEQDLEDAQLKSEALESTLNEYRQYKEELQGAVNEERIKNKELTRTLLDVKDQLEGRNESYRSLYAKTDQLRNDMTLAVRNLGAEQAEWRQREHELLTKMTIISNSLDQALRQREKAEVDYNALSRQHKEGLLYQDRFENAQQEVARAHDTIAALRNETAKRANEMAALERELEMARAGKDADVAIATARLEAEAETVRSQLESLRTDSEARIVRLQSRLDQAEIDLEDQKANHDSLMSDALESHKHVVQEAQEKHDAALEEQHGAHERHLTDLRERHTRAMHNSSDDKHRIEHQFNERLALGDERVKFLEGKVSDLEERLEITKSAARAAVQAASAKGVNLPTPASSVVASPPQRAASASLSLVRGTELPEKIPVQSLRESIMVLQDQLQNREQKIEKLEAELAAVDKELPRKMKERETEVGWLRELLGMRLDDIEDLIRTLSRPSYSREAAKDAAIRLKANIQMEQQIRERAAGGSAPAIPSVASLSTIAQSPRTALPFAAAAFSNLRKGATTGVGALGDMASNYMNQTPSKTTGMNSPGSWASGIMTPPNTQMPNRSRDSSVSRGGDMPPQSMRPLAAAAAARKAGTAGPGSTASTPLPEPRPLRAFSSRPRALKSGLVQSLEDPLAGPSSPTSPRTPTVWKGKERENDFGEDVDEDASPLEGRDGRFRDLEPPLAEQDEDAEQE